MTYKWMTISRNYLLRINFWYDSILCFWMITTTFNFLKLVSNFSRFSDLINHWKTNLLLLWLGIWILCNIHRTIFSLSIIITIWLRSRIFRTNWISYHETLIILLIGIIHKINHYDLIWIFIWDHFKCYRWLPWLCDNIWFISDVFLLLLLNTFPILIR